MRQMSFRMLFRQVVSSFVFSQNRHSSLVNGQHYTRPASVYLADDKVLDVAFQHPEHAVVNVHTHLSVGFSPLDDHKTPMKICFSLVTKVLSSPYIVPLAVVGKCFPQACLGIRFPKKLVRFFLRLVSGLPRPIILAITPIVDCSYQQGHP